MSPSFIQKSLFPFLHEKGIYVNELERVCTHGVFTYTITLHCQGQTSQLSHEDDKPTYLPPLGIFMPEYKLTALLCFSMMSNESLHAALIALGISQHEILNLFTSQLNA